MIILKKISSYVWMIVFFILLIIFIFRSLLLNISTNLLDWQDYSLMVWITNQNAGHIKNFQINNFFNSNIFYPFEGTMLFSDLLLPSSILTLMFQQFSSNPILVFNLIFFTTLILNIWSSFLLWRLFFKQGLLIFFGTLVSAFSPYFFMELNHFQMINFWPIFFGLYFLFKEQYTVKNSILVGVMISLEFFLSVYLWVFMLFAIGIWYVMQFLYRYFQKKFLKNIIVHGFLVLMTISVLSGVFVLKYIQVKQSYDIVRPPEEYILYSAHLSDYLFTTYYKSFLYSTKLANLWNSYNQHNVGESGAFPGIVLLFLSVTGLIILRKKIRSFSILIKLSFYNIYFFILLVSGFLFSLGPRLSINGAYTGIPLPYYAILKFIPLVEPIRANARWMFLLFLGLSYFAVLGLKRLNSGGKRSLILTIIFSAIFLLEIVPFNKITGKKEYYPVVYNTLEEKCTPDPKILLEYPLSRFTTQNNIIEDLTYKNQLQLASLRHKCKLVNGYSGYTPKDYERYEDQLFWAIERKDEDMFWRLMSERKVNFLKLNKDSLYEDRVVTIENWLRDELKSKIYLDDDKYLLVELSQVN